MSLCLAAAAASVAIAAESFTLAWTHTVEKMEWQEDWRIAGGRMILEQARVKGSGAGIDPPPDARLVGGFYEWSPKIVRQEIELRRDPHAGDWRLCAAGRCAPLGEWLGVDADPVRVFPAPDGACKDIR